MAEIVRYIIGGKGREIPVLRLGKGEKVSVPGVYDMPMHVYHGDCCIGPSISSTGLRTIYHRSPLHYWDTSIYNPNREEDSPEDPEAKHFRIGRAAHTLMLEPHLFKSQFIARPPMFADWRTKAAKTWRGEQQLAGMTVLDPADMLEIHGIAQAMKNHYLYRDGILEGDIELSLICQDAKTGVWLKARPDVIPRGTDMFADLKTTNDASTSAIEKKVFRLGYDMQMALGGRLMLELLGRIVDEYILVAVETKRPHAIRIAPIYPDEIGTALLMLRFSINKFAECMAANEWPSFEKDDNSYLHRSNFQKKMIEAEIVNGTIPREY